MNDSGLNLENISPVLKKMLDTSISKNIAEQLGPDISHVSPNTVKRMEEANRRGEQEKLGTYIQLEEKQRASVDFSTGLKEKGSYWSELDNEVRKSLRSLRDEDTDTLHVIHFDLGMLNGVNAEAGHSGGDAYKQYIAQTLINPFHKATFDPKNPLVRYIYEHFTDFKAYLMGGDEFALIIRGNHRDVLEYMNEIEIKLQNAETPLLNILPSSFGVARTDLLDWGIAQLDKKAKDDFISMNFDIEKGEERSGDVERCSKFLDEVADTKSDMQKMYKRIALLAKLKNQEQADPSIFRRLLQFSAKATWGIHDSQLKEMSLAQDPQPLMHEYVSDSFKRRAHRRSLDLQDKFIAHVNRYIYDHIDDYMKQL